MSEETPAMTDEHEEMGAREDSPQEGASPSAPVAPDAAAVNEAWDVEPAAPRGVRGLLFRLVSRLLRPRFDARRAFNSQQVRLDNALLQHIEERDEAIHAHYDRILGVYGRHIEEVDDRHVALQKDLVKHFDDLVRRTDLVLNETERGRLALEHELRQLRRRVARLAEAPTPSGSAGPGRRG